MMTGRCVPDVKCTALREHTIAAFVSGVYGAWTTTALGTSCVKGLISDITEPQFN